MIIDSLHAICIFVSIVLCLSDVVFLGAEKLTLLICLFYMAVPDLVYHFQLLCQSEILNNR